MRKAVLLVALATIVASSFAQFEEVKGEHEFSGRMIARPAQMVDLAAKGFGYAESQAVRKAAYVALAPYTIRYIPETDEYILKVPKGSNENDLARKLNQRAVFQYVEPDYIVFPLVVPNDPQVGAQWHVAKVQAYQAWDLFNAATANTIVAITDTGVKTAHEDLVARLVPGANTATGTAIPQASGGLVEDINGHGTHCAGIAAASGNNGLGVSGMGWGLKIMPVRVTNSTGGSASYTALTAAARWAAENGARVVSTSYSGVNNATIQTTGAYLRTLNTLYCYAAGNSNTNLSTFDHADVTIVGATDSADAKASFSSYGLATDVFAPGVSILATIRTANNTYGLMSGTSMATPCAAGIATLITASNPSMTSYEVQTSLQQCDDLGAAGEDATYGWGRVNSNKALRYAYNNYPAVPTMLNVFAWSRVLDPLANLYRSDDVRSAIPGGFETRITFHATLQLINTMELVLESNADPIGGGTIHLETAGGVLLGDFPTSATDSTINVSVPLSAYNGSTGDVEIDVTFLPNVPSGSRFSARIDRAGLFTKPL